MNEIDFRNWLINKGEKPKVASDIISRLKRIEHEINHCDIDMQYRSDRCERLLSMFLNSGNNDEMQNHPEANFPIGKYHLSTYRHALKKYIEFRESKDSI